MATAVYVLCALASLTCAALLWRGWRSSGVRLLLWSFLCFAMLTINNILLVVDLTVVPGTDLSVGRAVTNLIAVSALVYGMFLESSDRRAGP